MKVRLGDLQPMPVTHDPQLMKRVLLKDADTHSNLKMLNHTAMAPGESFRAHAHQTMEEVFYFLAGEGEFVLGDERLAVVAGDCVYVPSQTDHSCLSTGKTDLVFLAFGIGLEES